MPHQQGLAGVLGHVSSGERISAADCWLSWVPLLVAVLPTPHLADARCCLVSASSEKRKPPEAKSIHLPSVNSHTARTATLGPAGGDGGVPTALSEVSPMIQSLLDGPPVPLNSLSYNANTCEPV